ncbi:hypothetical protein GCM10008018_48110 [Paenibacillus marchantiophytorum]|uniref:Uncharacterized protein n=1 Tax=Paenibacillus marchantiophytorum TaxID=1619310 RepID=A0ABQ1F0M3_9BACL|nr:prolipoprotein diacylglyceryl transferase family protein [Paenibacillus marchantiophytorum]GFZ96059.1 hypothetical protein GCM10008018_48110 [Paenibacillus marchantiophytorum]
MPDVLQIGPLQLQGKLVAVLLAAILGLWMIGIFGRRSVRRTQDMQAKPISDIAFNAAVIMLLTWKLGILLTQPSMLWKSPLKILMVSGSSMEILLGLLFACVYTYIQLRKHAIRLYVFLDIFTLGLTASLFLVCTLLPVYGLPTDLPWGIGPEGTISRFHPYHAYTALLLVPLLIWQHAREWRKHSIGQGNLLKYSLLYGGVAGMLASLFAAAEATVVYLSLPQLAYLLMLILGMLLPTLAHNTGRRELMSMSQNDSKTQVQQEQQNKEREKAAPAGKEGFVDKKLDGPNRPST